MSRPQQKQSQPIEFYGLAPTDQQLQADSHHLGAGMWVGGHRATTHLVAGLQTAPVVPTAETCLTYLPYTIPCMASSAATTDCSGAPAPAFHCCFLLCCLFLALTGPEGIPC
jgi:hypothetical protein